MIIKVMIKYQTYLIIHINYWLNYIHLNSCVICCYFMLVSKKTVSNENPVCVHVRWTEKSGNQIWFDWLIESDSSPRSFQEVEVQVVEESHLSRKGDERWCVMTVHSKQKRNIITVWRWFWGVSWQQILTKLRQSDGMLYFWFSAIIHQCCVTLTTPCTIL